MSAHSPRSSFSRWFAGAPAPAPAQATPDTVETWVRQSQLAAVERCEILGQVLALRDANSAEMQVQYTILVSLAKSTRRVNSDRRIVQRSKQWPAI